MRQILIMKKILPIRMKMQRLMLILKVCEISFHKIVIQRVVIQGFMFEISLLLIIFVLMNLNFLLFFNLHRFYVPFYYNIYKQFASFLL